MSGEMNISFGGQKKITANHQNMNGIKQGAFKTDKDKAIFNKFDKDNNGVLDRQELSQMIRDIGQAAGGGNSPVMSKKEMAAFLKAQGFSDEEIKNMTRKDLYNFVNTIAEDKDGMTEAKWDGNTFIQEENGSRIETKYRDDEHKIKESATVTNDQGSLTELYDEAGDLSQIITKHGAITTTQDKDNKILKQVKDIGNDLQEITEFEYGEDGKLVQKKVTGPDGTVKVFDKDGKEIVQEEPQQTTQAKLQEKFGDAGKVSVTVDGGGSVPKISRGDYAGEIRLPNGAQIEDGKFPEQLRMTLPDDYKNRGNNGADPVMKLTLIDPENGVYETTGGKRNFQVQVNDDGGVYVKSVAVGEFPKAAAQAGAASDSAEAAVQQAGDQGAQQAGDAGAKVADDAAAAQAAGDEVAQAGAQDGAERAAAEEVAADEAGDETVQEAAQDGTKQAPADADESDNKEKVEAPKSEGADKAKSKSQIRHEERAQRREERAEAREDRKEARAQRREDRAEARAERAEARAQSREAAQKAGDTSKADSGRPPFMDGSKDFALKIGDKSTKVKDGKYYIDNKEVTQREYLAAMPSALIGGLKYEFINDNGNMRLEKEGTVSIASSPFWYRLNNDIVNKKLTVDSDGIYEFNGRKYGDYNSAQRGVQVQIGRLSINHAVYLDLLSKQEQGTELTEQQKVFMQNFENEMSKLL